jgi:hypothetical protein
MRRDELACAIAPLTGFHFVTHQHTNLDTAIGLRGRSNPHRICHL